MCVCGVRAWDGGGWCAASPQPTAHQPTSPMHVCHCVKIDSGRAAHLDSPAVAAFVGIFLKPHAIGLVGRSCSESGGGGVVERRKVSYGTVECWGD